MKFQSKHKTFHLRKCIWKCRLRKLNANYCSVVQTNGWLTDEIRLLLSITNQWKAHDNFWSISVQCGAAITPGRFSPKSSQKTPHPIARPWGRVMGCLLWVQTYIDILLLSPQWCIQYHVILGRVITALDCIMIFQRCFKGDTWSRLPAVYGHTILWCVFALNWF